MACRSSPSPSDVTGPKSPAGSKSPTPACVYLLSPERLPAAVTAARGLTAGAQRVAEAFKAAGGAGAAATLEHLAAGTGLDRMPL